MTDERRLPVGRLGRLARLAGVGARTGASLLVSRGGEQAAAHAVEVLGTMRGLAAKVGQMASYVDGFVPEAQREAYEKAMGQLRSAAPSSSFAQIRAVIEEDLGAPLGRLFESFDEAPFASASIGQVHRARLEGGLEVAVKVQHPGVDRAVRADLDNAGVLESIVGAATMGRLGTREIVDEVRKRFLEELDYELEASRQRRFAEVHAADPMVRVPRVFEERSSRRVLTSELASGKTLEEAALGGEAERARHCETLWRFVFRGNLVGGIFNADPHPGNYLFQDDGGVVFLDFGCAQPLDDENRRRALAVHRAAIERDEAAFARGVEALLGTRGGLYGELTLGYTRRCFEPLLRSPFRITRPYVAALVESTHELKRAMFTRGSGFVPLPREMVFLNRLQFGFYSVLARLDAEVDYASLERRVLEEAGIW